MRNIAIRALLCLMAASLPGASAEAAPVPVDALRLGKLLDRMDPASPETRAENDDRDEDNARKDIPIETVCEHLADAAHAHGLPVSFLARLIWQESRFNPRAVSPVGARGLAQFMPRTAAAYGLEDPFDPLAALPASARFLRELRNQFGNLGLAAAAYNAGPGRIQSWLARRGRLPQETRNYVKIITGQPPEKWTDEDKTIDLALALPARAPCEGVAGLSRNQESISVSVNLTDNIAKLIQVAEAQAAAAARELARKRAQAAKSGKARATVLARRIGGGKVKVSAAVPRIMAEERVTKRSARGKTDISSRARKPGERVAGKTKSRR